ncbi:hypothetical protein Tco_1475108 [Tanacetum coccineum]
MWINRESARDVNSRHRILAVTKLKIVKWHNYKHLEWITVRRDDDKLYTFKEGDYNRLRLQDIEDMLLLLVQGKMTNLNIEERLALGVSLRMFTRSIVLRRRVEDIQLGVESYQKKLNLTRPDTYRSDLKRGRLILATYGDTVTLKRRRDDDDDNEEPSAGLNRGSKRRRSRKEPESTSVPKEKTSKSTSKSKEGSKSHQKSIDQPIDETTQLLDWFQKPTKPPTPDCDWNKTLPAVHGPIQPWISTLARNEDPRESFNELMDTPLDFSSFVLNRLKVDTLTLELLVGPTFELMKGSCKSLVELEYFLEEVFKATTNQLDWNI